MASHNNAGYHDCPCRDCFEIAIGCDDEGAPDLCNECEDAGCDASGESDCERDGDEGEGVCVETMPDQFRESHRAARNWGIYPHNGAVRTYVASRAEAEAIVAADPDGYARIVE